MHSRKTNLILQKRAISSSWLTGTPWGILENILLRHALADNIIGLLGFDLMFSFFFFFSGFLMFWFVRMNTCLKKQELGYWGICLFQALFPNLVSVGIARCSWYFRGLILGPSFSDVGLSPTQHLYIEKAYWKICFYLWWGFKTFEDIFFPSEFK